MRQCFHEDGFRQSRLLHRRWIITFLTTISMNTIPVISFHQSTLLPFSRSWSKNSIKIDNSMLRNNVFESLQPFVNHRGGGILNSKQSDEEEEDPAVSDEENPKNENDEKPPSKKKSRKKKKKKNQKEWLDLIDPYKAGKRLRETIDSALTTLPGLSSSRQRSIYYLDDRFMENTGTGAGNVPIFAERSPLFKSLDEKNKPEVLVVGATGEVGRLVVRRLLRDGGFRVRVLVRDLYSKTLNLLGTGVTYCQGDLNDIESLEYAVTDVDKIIFCAGAPRPDEKDFQLKFEEFVDENLVPTGHANEESSTTTAATQIRDMRANSDNTAPKQTKNDDATIDWQKAETVLQLRAKLAEQVDFIGMQNLVRAYQNVRHADYGTSQAAKRSLFKFQDRPGDFELFSVDVEEEEGVASGEDSATKPKKRGTAAVAPGLKPQCGWIKNKFEHGVFVGSVPTTPIGKGGEAAIISGRLRTRDDPDAGIDLSNGFAGFVIRLCADGGVYEAFVRTADYDKKGIEYICEFDTGRKKKDGNKSPNKFVTVRLPFSKFQPVRRKPVSKTLSKGDEQKLSSFDGKDMQQLGFRFRSERNLRQDGTNALSPNDLRVNKNKANFYLALCYIKVYRVQPEPEFIYLSDARIPHHVKQAKIIHEAKKIVTVTNNDLSYSILDETEARKGMSRDLINRIGEETYYKYCGEQILRNSGLSYAIVRVAGYNELLSGELSTVRLLQSNNDIKAVSRSDVAEVCASCLIDPNASNVSFYVSKVAPSSSINVEEDMSAKIALLQTDS